MSDIPEDIMKAARAAYHGPFRDAVDSAPVNEIIKSVATAILAERKASVEAVLDALLAHELYKYRPGAFKGFIAYARETFCPEFRGEV